MKNPYIKALKDSVETLDNLGEVEYEMRLEVAKKLRDEVVSLEKENERLKDNFKYFQRVCEEISLCKLEGLLRDLPRFKV